MREVTADPPTSYQGEQWFCFWFLMWLQPEVWGDLGARMGGVNPSDGNCDVTAFLNSNEKLDFLSITKNSELRETFLERNIDCKFYNEFSLCQKLKKTSNFLCLSSNVQSLASKFNELCSFLDVLSSNSISPDVFAVQEVWNGNVESFNIEGYRFFSKTRKKGRGGGVGLYVKDKYNAKVLERYSTFKENIIESIAVEIEIPKVKKFVAISLYRPNRHTTLSQSEQIAIFFEEFTKQLESLAQLNTPVHIFTDTNIDILKHGVDPNADFLIDLSMSFGLFQLITKATRIHGVSTTLIDHIFTNDISENIVSGVLTDSLSDHFITFCTLNFEKPKSKPQIIFVRNFSKKNKLAFKRALANQSWEEITSSQCPSKSYEIFWDTFSFFFNLYFPLKKVKLNPKKHPVNPFMTPALLISRNQKLKLAKKAKVNPTLENSTNYRNYRNIYNKVVKKSKQLYFQAKFEQAGNNSREVWKVIREATNMKTNKSSTVESIKVNKILITEQQEIANKFNEFFANIGQHVAASVHPTSKNFKDYLPPASQNSLFLNPVGLFTIIETINAMDKKKSTDINGISIKFLQEFADQIACPLTHIFNLSVETGIFPAGMKTSKTIPVFKNVDSKFEMNNYRPISLVNSFSKIFEKIISIQLINFLNQHDFFAESQFGFLKARSTNHAVVNILNYITKALNEEKTVVGMFLDVQKAFDSVNHEILLAKLNNAGVRGVAADWFKSFLSNRIQKVKIGPSLSENTCTLNLGVLQGSILGVLLFLIFINDIFNASPSLFSTLYADDINSFSADNNINALQMKCNDELNHLAMWYRSNKLSVHPKKSKFMIFRPNNKSLDVPFSLYLNNNDPLFNDNKKIVALEQVTNNSEEPFVKILGILFDEKLLFDKHVNFVKAKISKSLYSLSRVKNLLSSDTLRLIYFANIHSHLNYCSNMYTLARKKDLLKLVNIQKRAVRIVTKSKYNSHTAPLFIKTQIIPLLELIKYNTVMFMYDFQANKLPSAFNGTWTRNFEHNVYTFRNANDFYIPRIRFERLNSHPLFKFPRIWNDIDRRFKEFLVRSEFRNALKEYYFHNLDNLIPLNCSCYVCEPRLQFDPVNLL